MLIKIIEDNKLYVYDNAKHVKRHHFKIFNNNDENNTIANNQNNKKQVNIDDFTVNPFGREIYTKNWTKYIILKKGDTFYKIAKEFELMVWQLTKYNDLTEDSILREGEILYIKPKRNRAERRFNYHFVNPGETMHSISQYYGIKLKKLYKKNYLMPNATIKPGDKLWLRKRKPANTN